MVVIMEKTFMDRTRWGAGPWDNEPDKVQFKDADTDYDCIVRRGPLGAWCGYVGVPGGHPYFNKGYNDIDDVDVHGGLTFADHCHGDEETGICHKSENEVWWIGFDCGHWSDLMPGMGDQFRIESGEHINYRDIDYVKNETLNLARQLKNIELGIASNEIQSTH